MLILLISLGLLLALSVVWLGLSVTIAQSSGGAVAVSGQVTVSDNLLVEAGPVTVLAAQPATLTTRTNNSTGTLTMTNSNHGIVTGQRLDLYWPTATVPGQTFNVTAGTVAGTSVPITCNTTGLSAPTAVGLLSQVAGGTITGVTYFVKITYVNANGETVGGTESSLAVSTNNLLVVASPPASGTGELIATAYNVYVSLTTNTETKQNATPIPLGQSWTEPTTGLIAGAALPSSSSSGANLPPASTAIAVGIPVQTSFVVTGPNLTALLLGSPQQALFCFDTGTTDDLAIALGANQAYVWCNALPFPNPLAAFTTASVWISHASTLAAVTTMQAAALAH